MKEAKTKEFHGIALYEIGLDGCLTGVYTNNYSGIIYNEINKKKVPDGKIEGEYFCQFFELNGSSPFNTDYVNGELSIIQDKAKPNVYSFVWKDIKALVKYQGVGFQMNKDQIAVYYWIC